MSTPLWPAMTANLWAAVSGEPESPVAVEVDGHRGGLSSSLPVEDAATACIATALIAATGPSQPVRLQAGHVRDAVVSERHLRVAGGMPAGGSFAQLSRFWPTADGWLRTHANYPWHGDALVQALEVAPAPGAVADAIRRARSVELEDRIVRAGGVAAAVRTEQEWEAHPQGRSVAAQPLVRSRRVGDAPARRRTPGELPASGVRVLDLTRVIAGPVCTRYLGALGADVLRLDPPHRPEPDGTWDTLLGKRSAVLDARSADGLSRLHELLDQADVLVHGYRPAALESYGISADELADRHPGLVVVQLSAWGTQGPWGRRRGFDSLVQAACGIAVAESVDGSTPGAMPCQLLDHGTGYLAAASALHALTVQAREGATQVRELSLAATARWLLSQPRDRPPMTGPVEASAADPSPSAEPDAAPWLVTVSSPAGPLTAVAPPGAIGGQPLRWPPAVGGYGLAAAAFMTEPSPEPGPADQ